MKKSIMAIIHVDGKKLEVNGTDNLLQACLSLKLDIPYFCWHPALGSIGACRQCAVKQYKDEKDTQGRIVMSCMTPATEGTYISIEDKEAKEFRSRIVEWLMTSHPHDCPVCEEGGHCHLQDMIVMAGHNKRRYRFKKRTHQNQNLGPCISHEMNRCIACYRCVRFYNDYAGGSDLGVFGSHDNLYFGRAENGTLESEFSGNLTEVCPTGVFTDKTHSEHYTRKWDMQFSPSICHGCAEGCNISPGERYGEIRRIENRYHGSVNQYFICDRGRFGYAYLNNPDRPKTPILLQDNKTKVLGVDSSLDKASNLLRGRTVIGIGSPRASLESNYSLRQLVGSEKFYSGIEEKELECIKLAHKVLRESPLPIPSLREIEDHDAAFVFGVDLTQTAPRTALSLRQMVKGKAKDAAQRKNINTWLDSAVKNIAQDLKHPTFIASLIETKLDDIAQECFHSSPDDLARIGFAIAHFIDDSSPEINDRLSPEELTFVRNTSNALLAAKRPLIVSGTALGSKEIIEASSNIVKSLHQKRKKGSISFVLPEVNSLGVSMISSKSLDSGLEEIARGAADAIVILENDLFRRLPNEKVKNALDSAKAVIVADHQKTDTTAYADLILPVTSFVESTGTVISHEGRAQRFFQVFQPTYLDPKSLIHEGWRWMQALHNDLTSNPLTWTLLDQITEEISSNIPGLQDIVKASPSASFRIKGLKIAREPIRYSGRTAMRSNISVHEPITPQDPGTSFNFSMEGYSGSTEARKEIPFAWAPGWNSPQAWNKFQDEVGGHLHSGDPGIRLIEPSGDKLKWFSSISRKHIHILGSWTVVPFYHLFGSEENSSKCDPIKKRMPSSYAALNESELKYLGVDEGDVLTITINKAALTLPVRSCKNLKRGLLALPVGLPGIPPSVLGNTAHIREAKS